MYMCCADELITRLLTGLACQLFPIVCYVLLLCIQHFVPGKQQKQMFKPGADLRCKLHNSIAVNEGISLMYAQVKAILTTELWLIVQTAWAQTLPSANEAVSKGLSACQRAASQWGRRRPGPGQTSLVSSSWPPVCAPSPISDAAQQHWATANSCAC